MVLTINQIIQILKQGKYSDNLSQIRAGDRAFHLYPSIEVTMPQPLSPTTDPELNTQEEIFQIKIFIRFTRELSVEYDSLNLDEREVIRVLGLQPLQDGVFHFESEIWNRDQTKDVQGVESTLRVMFRQIVGTEDGTVVGGDSTLQIGNVVLDLIGVSTGDIGINHSELWDDKAKRFPIPDGNVGVRFFEYAWTQDLYNEVQGLIDGRSYLPATLVQPNGEQEYYDVLVVRQRDQTSFSGLKTVTVQYEIVG